VKGQITRKSEPLDFKVATWSRAPLLSFTFRRPCREGHFFRRIVYGCNFTEIEGHVYHKGGHFFKDGQFYLNSEGLSVVVGRIWLQDSLNGSFRSSECSLSCL
jgi:hypothetical protein